MKWTGLLAVLLTILFCCPIATLAGPLAERLNCYPLLLGKPSLSSPERDLIYPDWLAGTWSVESILVEQLAPLAPDFVTPGFDKNRVYINQPVSFSVRFIPKRLPNSSLIRVLEPHPSIIADRAFNGTSIAKAYLGDKGILSVKVAPDNPNRQVSFFNNNLRLISTVIKRGSERPTKNLFIGSELSQQIFQTPESLYSNEVETTTSYRQISPGNIEADQVSAVYLSPQDPQYFLALNRPVALYHYRLKLSLLY